MFRPVLRDLLNPIALLKSRIRVETPGTNYVVALTVREAVNTCKLEERVRRSLWPFLHRLWATKLDSSAYQLAEQS